MLWIHPRRTLLVNYWKKLQYLIKQTLDRFELKIKFWAIYELIKTIILWWAIICPYYCLFPKAYKSYKRTQYRPHYPIVDYAIPGRVGPAFQNSRVVLSNTPLVTELLRGLDHVFTFFFVKSRLYVKLSIWVLDRIFTFYGAYYLKLLQIKILIMVSKTVFFINCWHLLTFDYLSTNLWNMDIMI